MMSLTLAYPWLLIGIPLFYLSLLFQKRTPLPAYGSVILFSDIPKSFRQRARPFVIHLLTLFTIISIFVGASRPQIVTLSEPSKHRNIMLAIDVSKSMEAEDIGDNLDSISRMEAVKKVVHEFITGRPQDRIGITIFAGRSYLQSPLTTDHQFLHHVLNSLQAGMAGLGTAIGDGLGLSIKRIRDLPADTRAIILVTDGANNAGRVNPNVCAEIAKSLGIKIHTIGIGGDPDESSQSMGGGLFRLLQPETEFDEELLKAIAAKTGGIYFNAGTYNKLRDVYSNLDKLLSSEFQDDSNRIVYEYYPHFAGASLLFFGLLYLASITVCKRTGGVW